MRSIFRYVRGGRLAESGGRYLGCWQELSEQAVGGILKNEAFLRVSRLVWREAGRDFFFQGYFSFRGAGERKRTRE